MGLNNVSRAFKGWLSPVTGTRQITSFERGRPVVDSTSNLSFDGVVQSATPDDLQTVPEGDRNTEAIKIHTEFEVLKKDLIDYNGSVWLAISIAYRFIGNYNKIIAVKQ